MNILILGASGLVGSNCMALLGDEENKVLGTYFSYEAENTVYFDTLNIDNPGNYELDDFYPDVIIHCGALTHVDYCEDNEEESSQKTVQSTLNAIDLCKKYGAKMVYLSTDYVFDGKSGPYFEDEPVNPISVYAKHKLEAETKVLESIEESIVIRITNVYGIEERNKNFVSRIVEKIYNDEEIELTLPYDQYATPVNAFDVARVIQVLLNDNKTGIYNAASTDYLNRCQLAGIIQKHFPKAKIKLTPVSTKELNQPAPRPLQGGLKMDKFLSEYPDFVFSNVDDFLNDLKFKMQ
ncbi:MAG: SDR family oxidoreductase [Bacteroidia bacterium]|nr:SDR family oxidoreductase [Bacteroidia bacterium]MBL4716361.1 SDR family oxidoreductase [Bacteroidia bacterium]